jgi:hypothetical protein
LFSANCGGACVLFGADSYCYQFVIFSNTFSLAINFTPLIHYKLSTTILLLLYCFIQLAIYIPIILMLCTNSDNEVDMSFILTTVRLGCSICNTSFSNASYPKFCIHFCFILFNRVYNILKGAKHDNIIMHDVFLFSLCLL